MNNRNLFVFNPLLYNLYGPSLAEGETPPPPGDMFLIDDATGDILIDDATKDFLLDT